MANRKSASYPQTLAKLRSGFMIKFCSLDQCFIATVSVILYYSKALGRKFNTVLVFVGPYTKPGHRGLLYIFYTSCDIPSGSLTALASKFTPMS